MSAQIDEKKLEKGEITMANAKSKRNFKDRRPVNLDINQRK